MALRAAFIRIVALVACVLATPNSKAADFQVSPVRIEMSPKTGSDILVVSNQSDEPLRLQVRVYAWDETIDGAMDLQPTEDVVAFPSILQVAPGQKRNIRVGAVRRARNLEKSYRIFVEELPPLKKHATQGIRVLMRLGIPVFLAPDRAQAAPKVKDLFLRDGRVHLVLQNTGNAHFVAQTIRIVARDEHDEIIFKDEHAGWYVLAGGERAYTFDLPEHACLARAFAVEVDTGSVKLARRAVSSEPCGRR